MSTDWFFASILAVVLSLVGTNVFGQRLVELAITGPRSIAEGATVSYTSTAHFDDGTEFDVTLPSTWSVVPNELATIDTFGTLVAGRVTRDEKIEVECTFTWLDVTLETSYPVTVVDVPKDEGIHPWPEWQRTPSRLGRTSTIGPQTPTIDWILQFDFSPLPSAPSASPVLDADNRLFAGAHDLLVCINTLSREIEWDFPAGDTVVSSPTIWDDRIVFGSSFDFVHCLDRRTGVEIWSEPALPHPNRGQAIDDALPGGVVYYPVDSDTIYARRVDDGSEVWTVPGPDAMVSPPTLDGLGFFYQGSAGGQNLSGFATIDGSGIWDAPVGTIQGPTPYYNGKVYASSVTLFCVDAVSGEIDWSFKDIRTTNSAIAIGHDGTIYAAEVIEDAYLLLRHRLFERF
jgi:outer membrane protein assembly factor BamB